jgi:phosphoribosyl 1,2-cyclic phosphodiesterase
MYWKNLQNYWEIKVKIRILASGSSGNATLIEIQGRRILIDAGIAKYLLLEAFEKYGRPEAVFITHSHGDHILSAGAMGRTLKIPIYMHPLTYSAKEDKLAGCNVQFTDPGVTPDIKLFDDKVTVKPFSTQHDTTACIGFIITDEVEKKKLCFITDTGCFTRLMMHVTKDCHGYIMEADYDDDLLDKTAEYDDVLKDRIRSDFGHLSNAQVMNYCKTLDFDKTTKFVIFGHLSEKTNSPETIKNHINNFFPKHADKFLIQPFDEEIIL